MYFIHKVWHHTTFDVYPKSKWPWQVNVWVDAGHRGGIDGASRDMREDFQKWQEWCTSRTRRSILEGINSSISFTVINMHGIFVIIPFKCFLLGWAVLVLYLICSAFLSWRSVEFYQVPFMYLLKWSYGFCLSFCGCDVLPLASVGPCPCDNTN